jgi:hypothetical protein
MKTMVAGVMLLLLFLIPGESFADQENCVRDFWGNCKVSSRRHGFHYRHCTKDFWGRCKDGRPPWRYTRHPHQHHIYRHHVGIDRGAVCHPRRRVVGEERTSKAKALKAADDAWMGAVRYDFGERYQDLNHAKDVRHNCDPSSTSSILKRVHFRCVIEATPCRAPTGTVEERIERRYEEEEDDDDRPRRK